MVCFKWKNAFEVFAVSNDISAGSSDIDDAAKRV